MLFIIKTLIPLPDDRHCVQLEGPLGGSSGMNQPPEFHVGGHWFALSWDLDLFQK